eukprot:2345465-Pleurochrysis_carterae.AAC.1
MIFELTIFGTWHFANTALGYFGKRFAKKPERQFSYTLHFGTTVPASSFSFKEIVVQVWRA